MKEKIMNSKSSYILYGVIALIIAALIFGISAAKYTGGVVAYSNYGVANFNAVILGDSSSGTVKAFDEEICADRCEPGMKYDSNEALNTAKIIPFSIANGISAENASETGLSYTLKLRTTRNIPLDFSLLNTVEDEENPRSTKTVMYKAGEPKLVQSSDDGSGITKNVWYEWTFYEDDGEEVKNVGENAAANEKKEVVFTLGGGALEIDNFQIIVEWPITEDGTIKVSDGSDGTVGIPDNSVDYMKEVDLIELFVTVSSKNTLEDEKTEYVYNLGEVYGKGIVILDPEIGAVSGNSDCTNQYSYLVDLRSFHTVDLSDNNSSIGSGSSSGSGSGADIMNNAYEFEINNGVGMGINPPSVNTYYYFELKVPYTSDIDEAYGMEDFEYSLYARNSENKYVALEPDGAEYRLYDVLYVSENFGKYEVVNINEILSGEAELPFGIVINEPEDGEEAIDMIAEWTKEKSQYRLYKVYSYKDSTQTIINKERDDNLNFTNKVGSKRYCLVINGLSNNDAEKFGNMVFNDKLEIVVNVDYGTTGSGKSGASDEPGDNSSGGSVDPNESNGGAN